MTSITTNYGLILYNDDTDVSASFIDFRMDLAGDTASGGSGSSNMVKIDEALGELAISASSISGSIITLQTSGSILNNEVKTGWILDSDTWVYVSATQFKITGKDVTAKFPVGTKIKLTQTTVKYFYVTAATFSTDTTVTVTGGSNYSLANATITDPYYSYVETPQGFPEWFNWTFSSITASGSMTVSNVSYVVTPRFKINGRWLTLKFRVDMTLGGTASNTIIFTGIPAPTLGTTQYLGSGIALIINKQCWLYSTSGNDGVRAFLYDNSNFTLGATNYGATGIATWEI